MLLPELPKAVAARLMTIGYTHIALLLCGDTDLTPTKRISSRRRSDPDFPPASPVGRSPTFDAKGVRKWLARNAPGSEGRTQTSLTEMA